MDADWAEKTDQNGLISDIHVISSKSFLSQPGVGVRPFTEKQIENGKSGNESMPLHENLRVLRGVRGFERIIPEISNWIFDVFAGIHDQRIYFQQGKNRTEAGSIPLKKCFSFPFVERENFLSIEFEVRRLSIRRLNGIGMYALPVRAVINADFSDGRVIVVFFDWNYKIHQSVCCDDGATIPYGLLDVMFVNVDDDLISFQSEGKPGDGRKVGG